jgi:hypothetical protein
MSYLNWREVARTEWESPRPPAPNGSTPAGTDYGVTVREQATWPDDGTVFAGRTYEQRWVYQGPGPEYRDHVVVSHSQYPAPGVAARPAPVTPRDIGSRGYFQGLSVVVEDVSTAGPYPRAQVRYDATSRTEWIAADAVRLI